MWMSQARLHNPLSKGHILNHTSCNERQIVNPTKPQNPKPSFEVSWFGIREFVGWAFGVGALGGLFLFRFEDSKRSPYEPSTFKLLLEPLNP